ncbi:hypothetical protein Tco_1450946 [Tanacetum coccineum]
MNRGNQAGSDEARARVFAVENAGQTWKPMSLRKMPPKRTTTTTTLMTDAQIKALISQGVADALAEHDAYRSKNDDDSHDSGSDGRRRMPVARECTYTDFLK